MPFDISKDQAQQLVPAYTIDARLTISSFKAAFRARDGNGTAVCLKIIDPQYPADRLQREILAMTKLDHPNIAKLIEYSFSATGGQTVQYMVEEFVEGEDLTGALVAPWPLDRIKAVFGPICRALEEMRKSELVHRDLKPSNIRLAKNDVPVVVDFGLVRHLDQPDLTATAHGARIGTPRYFAPEQFRGTKTDIEHRTDLFALGILLYEAATHLHPFDPNGNASIGELEVAVCDGGDHLLTPEFLSLDATLQLLLQKLLARSRADRPTTAAQVEKLLTKAGG